MSEIQSSNKRVAKNTIIVYVRLFVTMIVGLLTSRVVLRSLGASDYGLYNVVGGVLGMLAFLSSSLQSTTTRFINFEEGKKNGDTNLIFNVCLIVHIIAALIIFVLAESLGVYYLNHYLNVEPGKENDAHFVFQVSTIVACIGLINTPYQGLLVAKERFSTIAIVEIANSFLKLALVFSLYLFQDHLLKIFALFMSVLTLVTFVAYHWVCIKKWPETVKHNLSKTKGHYKEIISFNNYNLLGSASLTLRNQGSSIIINYFFGTVTNAAYAIARTVQNYVNNFTANFDVAAAPQITQNYSGGQKDKSNKMACVVGRLTMLMMEIAFFPIFVELEFLLKVWLVELPEGTLIFTQLSLVLVFVGATSSGLTRIISASGKIKWFQIQFSVLYILVLPLAFYLFKQGANPATIVFLFIMSDVLSRINQLILLRKIVKFDSLHFIKEAWLAPFIIAAIMFAIIIFLDFIMPNTTFCNITTIIITLVCVLGLSYFFGLKKNERYKVIQIVKNKLNI